MQAVRHFLILSLVGLVWCMVLSSPVSAFSPLLKIVSPTERQTIVGDTVTVSFILGNAVYGQEAHVHLWLDTDTPTASTATELTSHFDHILEHVPPGAHTLILEVVHPDHSSFTPPVIVSSPFTLQKQAAPTTIPRMGVYGVSVSTGQSVGAIAAVLLFALGIWIWQKRSA